MKQVIKYLKFLIHIHRFEPVVSQYWSFHTRRMVYGCKCGCKKIEFVSVPFGEPFPIETTSFLTNEEFNKILNS